MNAELEELFEKGWELPEGEHTLGGYRLIRDSKMLVMYPFLNKPADRATQIIVYPKPEHLEDFAKAIGSVMSGGPAIANPGGIGTVSITHKNRNEEPFLALKYAQAHYASNPLREKYRGSALPRSLATRYAGWRYRALRAAMQMAEREELPLVVPKGLFESFSAEKNGMLPNRLLADLRRAAKSLGAELDEGGNYAIFYPRKYRMWRP